MMAGASKLGDGSESKIRAISQRALSTSSGAPETGGRLVQVATAVSAKPPTAAPANPKIISCACHQLGAPSIPGNGRYPSQAPTQSGTTTIA